MATLTGTFTDVTGAPLRGVLWLSAGPRVTGGAVVVPRRRRYVLTDTGKVPSGVTVPPGPLSIEIDGPLEARHVWHVTVPEKSSVTVAELVGVQ